MDACERALLGAEGALHDGAKAVIGVNLIIGHEDGVGEVSGGPPHDAVAALGRHVLHHALGVDDCGGGGVEAVGGQEGRQTLLCLAEVEAEGMVAPKAHRLAAGGDGRPRGVGGGGLGLSLRKEGKGASGGSGDEAGLVGDDGREIDLVKVNILVLRGLVKTWGERVETRAEAEHLQALLR